MSEWITLDPTELAGDVKVERGSGIRTERHPSPHDIPEAVRGTIDKAGECFVLEFKYLGDEPTNRVHPTNRVDAAIGKHSHRIYQLLLNMKQETPHSKRMSQLLNEAINRLANDAADSHSRLTYSITKAALDAVLENILLSVYNTAAHDASETETSLGSRITKSLKLTSSRGDT